jgi:uncharacterized protein (TIGR03067 family)
MRATVACILVLGLLPAVGCARSEGKRDEPVPAKVVAEADPREVWEVVKLEWPWTDEPMRAAVEGVEVVVTKDGVELPKSGVLDHEFHWQQMGIDCRYCHTPGKPMSAARVEFKTCMNCHQQGPLAHDGTRLTPDNYAATAARLKEQTTFEMKLDATAKPMQADFQQRGAAELKLPTYRAIVKDEGNTRLVALSLQPNAPRPTEFKTAPPAKLGERSTILIHLRKK